LHCRAVQSHCLYNQLALPWLTAVWCGLRCCATALTSCESGSPAALPWRWKIAPALPAVHAPQRNGSAAALPRTVLPGPSCTASFTFARWTMPGHCRDRKQFRGKGEAWGWRNGDAWSMALILSRGKKRVRCSIARPLPGKSASRDCHSMSLSKHRIGTREYRCVSRPFGLALPGNGCQFRGAFSVCCQAGVRAW
jgi:hypothetical protein